MMRLLAVLAGLIGMLNLNSAFGCDSSALAGAALRADTAESFYQLDAARQPIKPANPDYSLLGEAIFHETNKRRRQQGQDALRYLGALIDPACNHANALAKKDFFAHTNPDTGRGPLERVEQTDLNPGFVAENIAETFALRYESGSAVYTRQANGAKIFSRTPGGPPIEPHSYLSFAQTLLDQWMGSPGHRRNILSPQPRAFGAACQQAESDIGMAVLYCVQLFFKTL